MAWLIPKNDIGERTEVTDRLVAGREEATDLHIAHRQVSRMHCVIERQGDGSYLLTDNGSANGTWVNGHRITSPHVLSEGDVIALGAPEILFSFHADVPPEELDELLDSHVQAKVAMAEDEDFAPQQQVGDTQQLRRDYERLRAAWQIMQRSAGEVRLDKLLSNALDGLLEMFRADRGVVLLKDRNGLLRRATSASRSGPLPSVSDTILNEVLDGRCGVITMDARVDERFSAAESIVASGIRSSMAVPLAHGPDILGVVVIDSVRAINAFDEDDLRVFETAARQVATSIHSLQMAADLKEKEALRQRFERIVTPTLAARIASGAMQVDRSGEVREVSVMFSDIRGFTKMSESRAPTQVVEMLNTYFEEMVDIIFEFEGTLDKFLGDAIMAVWGAPADQPDHAERAVRAAIRMQRRMNELAASVDKRVELPFDMGIGINSGEVVSGFIGSSMALDFTVIGDVVNTASRICSAAEPHTVTVGDATQARLQGLFDFYPRQTVAAKGKAEPVGVHVVRF